jgi:hypothetical protein
LHEGIIKVTA